MTHKIKKLLIANRGEIACRIIKTCRKMGIISVAIHSNVDVNAKFVREADEAYCLGGQTSQESYLNIPKIIEIAQSQAIDAIHPGYGFLSENEEFSRTVTEAGIIFIGPKPETIAKMGSKLESKNMMQAANVPVIPGYQGNDQSEATLFKEALKVGFPCMVKASAGGGGKGLKLVNKESELKEAISSAKRESLSSFNDDTLIVEKFITSPRHIEVQIFGDSHGNTVHLFDRECSLQRRHQKVIEEAPSGSMSDEQRENITAAAVSAAKAVNYEGAGTVEFVMGQDGEFYFLEMNTRLQVEHPVTEMITGTDLVKWQILVAQGEKLPLKQKEIKINGHAMEARVYAEDALNNFLPVSGKIAHINLSSEKNVRNDFGFASGDEISVFYDPMIGKIITWAETRQDCIQALSKAINKTSVLGTITNLAFLNTLVEHQDHISGNFDTGFIDSHLEELTDFSESKTHQLIAAALFFYFHTKEQKGSPLIKELAGFRIHPNQWIHESLSNQNDVQSFRYRKSHTNNKSFDFLLKEEKITVAVENFSDHSLQFSHGEKSYNFQYALANEQLYFKSKTGLVTFERNYYTEGDTLAEGENTLKAPLPGKVLKVFVKPDQEVKSGDTLVVVEAMKMEHPIKAPCDALVGEVLYTENANVKLGDVLLVLKEKRPSP